MTILATLQQVFADFRHQEHKARFIGQKYGDDTTGYGPGVRVIAASPFLNGWKVVSDPHWPLNWNAHLVLPNGTVVPASSMTGVRHDITITQPIANN